ncbi:hypothetical protein [Aquaticitalea lipolytica]|uniref:hypothetical protein n=1 Tax=Aquaticitalea lipolytica TaxID=1247562 RepID=UPI0024B879CC|nr:hypothetical protein [Aquaticitalea lipolytica]
MKTFKSIIVLPFILISLLITNCSPNGDDDNNPPSIFSTNTTSVGFDYAIIEWTESLDSDGDQVTYAIILEGFEVASDLTALTFPFYNLESDRLYNGYVESRDGNGGTNRADFFFRTDPEVLIIPITVEEFIRPTLNNCSNGVNTALEIDAGVIVPKYIGNVRYELSFSTLTLNNGAVTIAPASRTWTNASFSTYYIYDYDANNYFVWQAGAGFACSNHPNINDTRAYYSSASGQATITFTRLLN